MVKCKARRPLQATFPPIYQCTSKIYNVEAHSDQVHIHTHQRTYMCIYTPTMGKRKERERGGGSRPRRAHEMSVIPDEQISDKKMGMIDQQ